MTKSDQEKKTSTTLVVKSGLWYTICNVLTKSVGFLTTPIFTRLLTKAEFGEYNNFATWTGIFLLITSLNLEASMIRARYEFKDDIDSYVASMSILSELSTLFWFVLFCLFIEPAERFLALNSTEICAMFLYLLFYPSIQLFQTKERFEYRYKTTVLITLLVVVGTAFLSVVLVLLMKDKLFARIIGMVVPVIILGLLIQVLIVSRGKKVRIKYWDYALPFTLPFIPHLLSMYLLGSMDKVMIRHICGAEDLALYSLAYTVGTIITLLVSSMNNAFAPWLGDQLSKNNYEKIKCVSVPYVGLFTLFSIVSILITPEALQVLGGQGYLEAQFVIPQVFAGCLMQFIYCMYVNVEQFEKKTVGMAGASITAAIFNYITNYFFIKKYGYIAASYTTFFSYLILMILHIYLVRKIFKTGVYNDKMIFLIAIIGSVVLLLMNFVFRFIILRYVLFSLLLAGISIGAYINRSHFIQYLQKT